MTCFNKVLHRFHITPTHTHQECAGAAQPPDISTMRLKLAAKAEVLWNIKFCRTICNTAFEGEDWEADD